MRCVHFTLARLFHVDQTQPLFVTPPSPHTVPIVLPGRALWFSPLSSSSNTINFVALGASHAATRHATPQVESTRCACKVVEDYICHVRALCWLSHDHFCMTTCRWQGHREGLSVSICGTSIMVGENALLCMAALPRSTFTAQSGGRTASQIWDPDALPLLGPRVNVRLGWRPGLGRADNGTNRSRGTPRSGVTARYSPLQPGGGVVARVARSVFGFSTPKAASWWADTMKRQQYRRQ